ncbi:MULTISPECIES: RNA polymerase sigma factor SigB [Terrilactibacillus]|uniref:RNA polymerase sigma factor SigB n=2 Tax=Terrilactibacillus TaxID=1795633 RepID=A0A6N8CV57_9BACI|nr:MULTISPECIES: RNA polymerase sigma factor SigB [Terrilactibacillus]MTT33133.1 RNA polymerase sigma factor SigB [Terrilactibacillus tamarindi]
MPTESQQQQNEIQSLILDYQKNPDDETIQSKLLAKYEKLVIILSNKFAKSKDIQEDLYQVGMIGLLAAFKRFDPSFNRSFESFAMPTILGEIKRYIRDKTWGVHVPRRVKELGPKINKAVEHLTRELQRSPKVADIAEYLDVSEEDVLETMEMSNSYYALSVDRKIEADSEGSTVTLLDLVGKQEKGYTQIESQLLLKEAFHVLDDREKDILNYTYFENLSQKETGEKLGISQMHVSRLQRRALKKLRKTLPDEGLERLK